MESILVVIRRLGRIDRRLFVVLTLLTVIWTCQFSDDASNESTKRLTATDSTALSRMSNPANCGKCHEKQYKEWENSNHALALRRPHDSLFVKLPDTVALSNNRRYILYKKDHQYRVRTNDYYHKDADFEIRYVIGVDPLLQYVVALPKGRNQCLTFALDTRERVYFDLQYDTAAPAGDWLHWTGQSMTWNSACADCHSTAVQKNFDPATTTYQTTFRSIQITCEACHGTVKQLSTDENVCWLPATDRLETSSQIGQLNNCASCHSRRMQLGEHPPGNGDFHQTYALEASTDQLFHEDGQIKDEVFEYHSFTQSKMFAMGVKCTDCHNVHSGQLVASGNDLCTQCHVKADFDTPKHHFHLVGSAGAQCVNCHMPGKFYMERHFRRDHSLRIPRPDQSAAFGTPNACNNCHADKSAQWAANEVVKRHGPDRLEHFSDIMLGASPADSKSMDRLVNYINDLHNEPTPRLLAMDKFRRIATDRDFQERLSPLATDPAPELRGQYLSSVNDKSQITKMLMSALDDPDKSVRILAYRSLLTIPNPLPIHRAATDFLTMASFNADNASVLSDLAGYYHKLGQSQEAIRLYKNALAVDDKLPYPYINLAQLYSEQKQYVSAQQVLDDAIGKLPAWSTPYFYKALLYAETADTTRALEYLEKATDMEPENGQYAYNTAVLHMQLKNWEPAKKYMTQALKAEPGNARYAEAWEYLRREAAN